jgi:hypothetical protein
VKQVGKGSYGAALLVKLKIDPCVPHAARRAAKRLSTSALNRALAARAFLIRLGTRADAAARTRLATDAFRLGEPLLLLLLLADGRRQEPTQGML